MGMPQVRLRHIHRQDHGMPQMLREAGGETVSDTPTTYSYTYTWPTPTTTRVPDIIRRMEAIADDLKTAGVMNLGISLSRQIAELKEILGVGQ